MPFQAQVLQVLIASPGDTRPYRDAVERALHDWNRSQSRNAETVYLPRRWEFDAIPAFGIDAQSVINDQIVDEADLVIGLFWYRIGMTTARAASGSVEEIERCRTAGKGVHLFFGTMDVPHNVDLEQLQRLRDYQRQVSEAGLMGQYSSDSDLVAHVRRVLDHHAHMRRTPTTTAGPSSLSRPTSASPTPSRPAESPAKPVASAEGATPRLAHTLQGVVERASAPMPVPISVRLVERQDLRLRHNSKTQGRVIIRGISAAVNGHPIKTPVVDRSHLRPGNTRDVRMVDPPLSIGFGKLSVTVEYLVEGSKGVQTVYYEIEDDPEEKVRRVSLEGGTAEMMNTLTQLLDEHGVAFENRTPTRRDLAGGEQQVLRNLDTFGSGVALEDALSQFTVRFPNARFGIEV